MDMPSTKRGAGISDSRWFTNHQMTQKVTNDVIPIRNHTMILLPPSSGGSFESWHYLNHTESVLLGPVQRMSMTGNMCPTSHVAWCTSCVLVAWCTSWAGRSYLNTYSNNQLALNFWLWWPNSTRARTIVRSFAFRIARSLSAVLRTIIPKLIIAPLLHVHPFHSVTFT